MNDDEALAELLAHPGGEPVTCMFVLTTWVGAHRVAEHILGIARQAGTVADCESSGGWWRRTHLFRIAGTVDQLTAVIAERRRVLAAFSQ